MSCGFRGVIYLLITSSCGFSGVIYLLITSSCGFSGVIYFDTARAQAPDDQDADQHIFIVLGNLSPHS